MSGGRIVATERSDDSLREVQALGADTVVNTAVSDNELAEAFTAARGAGYDIVLDYLWGRPTEVLLRTLVPSSFAFPEPTRYPRRLRRMAQSAAPDGLTGTPSSKAAHIPCICPFHSCEDF